MSETVDVAISDGAILKVWLDGPPDAPAVTFTHSLAASSSMWSAQVEAIKDHFRTVRIDFRGHGGSSIEPAPSDFARLVQDVVDVWDALSIVRSHYVGLSLGGIVGAGLALSHPDRLGQTIIADCRFDATEGYLANWAHRRQLLDEGGMAAIADYTLPTWLTSSHIRDDPALVERLRNDIMNTAPEGWINIVTIFPGLDYKRQLGAIPFPVALVVGSEDAVRTEMEDCAKLCPSSSFFEIAQAGHLANVDQPAKFNKIMIDWLETNG